MAMKVSGLYLRTKRYTALLKEETSYICLASVFSTGWARSSTLSSVTVLLSNQTFFTDICAEHHSGRTVPSFGQDDASA